MTTVIHASIARLIDQRIALPAFGSESRTLTIKLIETFIGCSKPQVFNFEFEGKVNDQGEFKTNELIGVKQPGVVSWNEVFFTHVVNETNAEVPREVIADAMRV